MGCGVLSLSASTAKWLYLAAFIVLSVLEWVLRDFGTNLFGRIGGLNDCRQLASPADVKACVGNGVVLRISFGSFLFFAAQVVVLLGVRRNTDIRRYLHTALWPCQLLLLATLVVVCFLMPNGVFNVWGQIARILAAVFLVVQIILLLDFIFSVNEVLLDGQHGLVLVAATATMLAGSLVGIGFLYHFYAPFAHCGLNIFFITWTLILAGAVIALSVSPYRVQHAGLLTSAVVFIYTTFILWNALSSEPASDACAHVNGTSANWLRAVAFFLALGCAFHGTMTASQEGGKFFGRSTEAVDGELPYRPDCFCAVFALATAYMAMLLMSWQLNSVSGSTFTLQSGWASVWVKIVSQWVCVALYAWMLVAPKLLGSRDF